MYERISPQAPHPDWVEKIPDPKWREKFARMEQDEMAETIPENPIARFFRVWRGWWDKLLGD